MKKICIVSGGLDSVTMLHMVAELHGANNIVALSFNYGSKHNKKELSMARKNCNDLGIGHKIVNLEEVFKNFDSALLNHDDSEEIPAGHYQDDNMKKTVVPFRNGILLSIAVGFAENQGCDVVYYGAHTGDHDIYPDCRKRFVKAMSNATKEGTYNKVSVEAPYEEGDKTSIIKKGLLLGVDYAKTWTCYDPKEDKACGKCGSCQERLEAFKNNNLEDPLDYVTRETLIKK